MPVQRSIVGIISLVLICLGTFSCSPYKPSIGTLVSEKKQIMITPKQFLDEKMMLGMLQKEMIAETVSANGYVEVPPGSIASVSAYQSGYVIDLNLLPGQSVKKGERLFSIESPELITIQQQYLETSEALKYLKSVLEREKTLDQEKISAKKTFEKAENEYKIMWSRHEALKKQLALIHLPLTLLDSGTISSSIPILASISGFISAVNIHLGDFINEAEVAIEIINTSHIHLELQVFERDASRIKKGQELIFSLAQTPDIWYPADVHLVSKTISGSERTVKVHADVADDLAGRLIPGMFVKSKIDIDAKEAMCLPESALLTEVNKTSVLVKMGGNTGNYHFELIQVSTGIQEKGRVEILNYKDLQNKEILISGGFSLIQN